MISTYFLDSLDSWIGVVRAGVHTLGHPILNVSGIRRILYTCTCTIFRSSVTLLALVFDPSRYECV